MKKIFFLTLFFLFSSCRSAIPTKELPQTSISYQPLDIQQETNGWWTVNLNSKDLFNLSLRVLKQDHLLDWDTQRQKLETEWKNFVWKSKLHRYKLSIAVQRKQPHQSWLLITPYVEKLLGPNPKGVSHWLPLKEEEANDAFSEQFRHDLQHMSLLEWESEKKVSVR